MIYLATAGGTLDAIQASDGKLAWRANLESPIRRQPLLSRDAIYVATSANSVIALARTNGEILWRYRREMPEGFSITGNAGLLAADGKLFTAFSDGVVVSLDPSDGRLIWERDTSLDVEEKGNQSPLIDVDTTPVKVGNEIFVASFSAGLYALSPLNGTILWRVPELKTVTAIASDGSTIALSSAENGVVCMDATTHEFLWTHQVKRGYPGELMIADGLVFVGESEGGFLALSTKTGREQARLESGHGFSAAANVMGRRGFLVSNGGTLFAFSY
jgi:outer membrane protein assembly factor BamB